MQVFKCLKDPQSLKAAGFKLKFHSRIERQEALDQHSGLFTSEKAKAELLGNSALQVVRFRALSQLHYMTCPPMIVVGLLDSGDKFVSALQLCRDDWSCIQWLEKKRLNFIELDRLWNNLPFAKWEIVREVFCMLSEFNFEWISPPLQLTLEAMFMG